MIEWKDQGFLVHVAPLGEAGKILSFLTAHHGRHRGVIQTKNHHTFPSFFLGTRAQLMWKARLEDHVGRYTIDSMAGPIYSLFHHVAALEVVTLMGALVTSLLPERVPMPLVYQHFERTLGDLPTPDGLKSFDAFESLLFQELGYDAGESCDFPAPFQKKENHFWPSGTKKDVLTILLQRQRLFLAHWPHLYPLHQLRQNFLSVLLSSCP